MLGFALVRWCRITSMLLCPLCRCTLVSPLGGQLAHIQHQIQILALAAGRLQRLEAGQLDTPIRLVVVRARGRVGRGQLVRDVGRIVGHLHLSGY